MKCERGAAGCLGEAGGAMCCPDAEFKDNIKEEAQSQSCRRQNNEDAAYCKLHKRNVAQGEK